jgi:hypothetical protein
MSKAGPSRLALRVAADAVLGLILFAVFAVALGAFERTQVATHRLGGILSISSSAGELFKFSIDDSPLIAAAVVATAVPVPTTAAITMPHGPTKHAALVLLAGIFSTLVALNLAFFRHLRREYASPR